MKFRSRIKDLLKVEVGGSDQIRDDTNLVENEYLDDLLGLGRLLQLQRKRVEVLLKRELEDGIRNLGLCKELQGLSSLIKTLAEEREFVLQHPEFDPVMKRREQLREQRIRTNFNTLMENTTDESWERIPGAADIYLEMAAKEAVLITEEEDSNGNIRYKTIGK